MSSSAGNFGNRTGRDAGRADLGPPDEHRSRPRGSPALLFLLLLLLVVAPLSSRAGPGGPGPAEGTEGIAASELRPGLLAEIFPDTRREGPPVARRIDGRLTFQWEDAPPDLRLDPGGFSIRWIGTLFVPDDGTYRFHLRARGDARLVVGGRVLVDTGGPAGGATFSSEAVELEYGYLPLEATLTSPGGPSAIAAYWESETFAPEPLRRGAVYLPAASSGDAEPRELFERGLRIARRLRCGACHALAELPRPRLAPSLADARTLPDPAAIVSRLTDGGPGSPEMPVFPLEPAAARDVAACLHASGTVAAPGSDRREEEGRSGERNAAAREKERRRGRRLVLTTGCLACHTLEGAGASDGRGGPLDGALARRSAPALRARLVPAGSRAAHHPELPLDAQELRAVLAYLQAIAPPETSGREREPAAARRSACGSSPRATRRGRALIERFGCGACHELPEGSGAIPAAPLPAPPLHRGSRIDWTRSCIARGPPESPGPEDPESAARPYYRLSAEDAAAVRAFLERLSPEARLSRFETGRLLLEEEGCLSCHPREGAGLRDVARRVTAGHGFLRGHEAGLVAPSLASVGDKLEDDELARSIRGEQERRRPWLDVRMPRFHHSPEDAVAIETFLVVEDRVPEDIARQAPEVPAQTSPVELFEAGHRLAGPHGFACTSCHDIGTYEPPRVAPNVRGPDLQGLASRLRLPWFLRWMADPARVAPGVEMPAVSLGLPGVLGGERDLQLLALWRALDSPDFVAPAAARAERELAVPAGAPARVIRDVFRRRSGSPEAAARRAGGFGNGWTPRALAVGFPGGTSLLYDLDVFAPVSWWTDAFARQLTEGKTWYWEPAGTPVLEHLPPFPPLALAGREAEPPKKDDKDDTELVLPTLALQSVGRLGSWREGARAVELRYTLRFGGDDVLPVKETLAPLPKGFLRRLELRESPALLAERDVVALALLPESSRPRLEHGAASARTPRGPVRVEARSAEGSVPWETLSPSRTDGFELPARSVPFGSRMPRRPEGGPRWIELRFEAPRSGVTADLSLIARRTVERREARPVDVLPGFRGVRLPLDVELMPTSFAFGPEGAVFLASLDGDIVSLADRNGDGLEETATRVASHTSAPFGLLAEPEGLVVSHKPELARFSDGDGDGYLERARVVATGWGLSHDYHDWTFGLVREGGNYHVLLGSDYQQKGRPRATTRYRGKALRIEEGGKISVVARGLRFTVGIAADARGEIFFTDNQGVGNTFNEINHLVPGAAYGVPSLYDPPEDEGGGGEPPALRLPHPWTRSVNGIVFLDARFGPYAGHGVGCDYDTRKLVRFTLEEIGGAYQGACYPFSIPDESEAGLLGPIACGVSPGGELWIGSMKDSGWGGGTNVGSVARFRYTGNEPFGIREARARRRGFRLRFTRPCDPELAADPGSYTLTAYRRIWKGGYATEDQDRHRPEVRAVTVSEDGLAVELDVHPLRPGFLYEIHCRPLGTGGEDMWPRAAYYTLRAVPEG